jgi:hypothetical protein
MADTRTPFSNFIRVLAATAMAGMVAGVIVGGIGSRLAMRILAITSAPQATGILTENGNRVGEITLGGTLALLLVGGLLLGPIGGVAYLGVRRWLPGPAWVKGLSFGFLLLAVFGLGILNPGNADFTRLGPKSLSVTLFALLFPLFGLTLAPLAERLIRSFPAPWPPRRASLVYVPLLPVAVVTFPVSIPLLIVGYIVAAIGGSDRLARLWHGRAVGAVGAAVLVVGGSVSAVRVALGVAEIL